MFENLAALIIRNFAHHVIFRYESFGTLQADKIEVNNIS